MSQRGPLTPFGDHSVRFTIPAEVSAPRRALRAALSAVPGVADVVLAEDLGCVVLDDVADRNEAMAAIERAFASVASGASGGAERAVTSHTLPVVYDGEDLDAVATAIGRTREATIALHAERAYRVAMLGFLPGFAYLRDVAEPLRLPRRAPRPRVPPRSVAIAAQYTGIYPYASPGGWHLLGRAAGFEPFTAGHATLEIGDLVRFSPAAAPPTARAPASPAPSESLAGPHLEVTRALGFALLVDGGRRGRMHEGVPPGGPLVASWFARANALAGNGAGAAAVEITGTLEVVARAGSVGIADEHGFVELADGERHVVKSGGGARVAYLALRGGVDAPVVLGGRGALLVAGIGRLLKRGDRLAPAREGKGALKPMEPRILISGPLSLDAPVAVAPGPDEVPGFSLESLTRVELRVSQASDRTGTRLEGWVPEQRGGPVMTRPSAPMVKGAIELTPSGLIVLGPDHPTTGGYPVVAVVRESSLDALLARPVGSSLRLAIA
jgi:KipI family sensor histidine kinase inhibitor